MTRFSTASVESGRAWSNVVADSESETIVPYAIIRGKSGRRHEVDFGDEAVRVEIHSSEETVEIFIEADFETLPQGRRRFAILNIPRHLFSEAIGAATQHAAKSSAKGFRSQQKIESKRSL
jgi:hypothetical protein